MRQFHPVLALIATCLVTGLSLREATGADLPLDLLANAAENRVWWSPPGAFVTVYQPDQDSEPVLVFRKDGLRGLAITLDVSSDAKGLHLVSGSSDMDLRVTPKGRDSIVLDMVSSPPKLMV
ncbi:MAG: hypothetical protein OER86_12645, partial [Phycisphaerae bacterium]|nr:hypothetical protein [Phycisphaerae bacterium]